MMKLKTLALAATCFAALMSSSASARPAYVSQIPNINNNCGNCHVAEGGGGPRNVFGQDVEANMPFSGPDAETWGKIFCADSDGDGKTNGQELGDPCGTWKPGDADPAGDITRPDDEASTTADVGACDGAAPPTCELEAASGCGGCSGGNASPDVALTALLTAALLLVRRARSR